MKDKIKLFENRKIRAIWDEGAEKWWFSVVDIIAALTESDNPQVYWRVLKKRLADEGNETVTNCNGLKMLAPDGKMRLTDVADTEQFLRVIQSIPSKKAEPFKLWLAKVGSERMDETVDKQFKGLKKESLRDNMTNTELVLNMLAEVAATDISIERQPVNFSESAQVAAEGAKAAQVARKQIEKSTGKPAISPLNAHSGLMIGRGENKK